ncbi:hypothetical protein ACXHXG_21255 [Rhizobium sp. LEGMi198b]|uniref:hypothetical protein n=1 Tax=Rhizobium sp. NXC24 TaxID=2048897 RepID=UPI000CDF443D|nr:hypothetical protein [Rhizobium sp. NXC24]AVA24910.1 hypothetical protein NXC24_PC00465 [Rhizobium sp. NXC24]
MNKFFIASAIAAASLAATALPSHAASVEVMTDGGPYYHHRHHYDDRDDGYYGRHNRHCFTKVVKEWHHGHRVVTEERVCR